MSCRWDRNTERYDRCDGHGRCYCTTCNRCDEPVDSVDNLKNGICSYCQKESEQKQAVDEIRELHVDYCVSCGNDHSYASGPCEFCGQKTFTKKIIVPRG